MSDAPMEKSQNPLSGTKPKSSIFDRAILRRTMSDDAKKPADNESYVDKHEAWSGGGIVNLAKKFLFNPLSTAQTSTTDFDELDPESIFQMRFSDMGENIQMLLESNKRWASRISRRRPEYFKNTAKEQNPKLLWFGCSDSRVPANAVVQLAPGEIFVHRNIANLFIHTDMNCLSVLQYAVDVLKVEHVIVCGHYGCGGVIASMTNYQYGLIDNWLRHIKDVYCANRASLDAIEDTVERQKLMVELNVAQQVYNISHTTIVQNAWVRGQSVAIHGWVYNLEDGLLKDLEMQINKFEDMEDPIFQVAYSDK